jgi:hypothetical protein
MADANTLIPEEVMVALTAIHQVCPQLLTSKPSPLFADCYPDRAQFDEKLVQSAKAFVDRHNALSAQVATHGKPFAPFPKYLQRDRPVPGDRGGVSGGRQVPRSAG